jgi:hypothetical protein
LRQASAAPRAASRCGDLLAADRTVLLAEPLPPPLKESSFSRGFESLWRGISAASPGANA